MCVCVSEHVCVHPPLSPLSFSFLSLRVSIQGLLGVGAEAVAVDHGPPLRGVEALLNVLIQLCAELFPALIRNGHHHNRNAGSNVL